MRFNDRSLALLGVPDLPERAFIKDAVGRIQPQGGGGTSGSGGGGDSDVNARAESRLARQSEQGYVTTRDGTVVTDGFGGAVYAGGGDYSYTGGGGSTGSPGYSNFYYPPYPESGVYKGSLSSLGNMVAMCLGEPYEGMYKVITPGNTSKGYLDAGKYVAGSTVNGLVGASSVTLSATPYSTGYFREYWNNPTNCTFGANSAMPALTGVMPSSYTDMQGNFVYYVDLQLQRLSGSNTWDNLYFMSAFNQAVGWVVNANNYLASLKIAQDTNLGYYSASDYADLATQGFNRYQVGYALRAALRNLGVTVSTISDGYFGTPNAVAKSIIDNGLGAINGFSRNLSRQGVIAADIYNPNYTAAISAELAAITNVADLAVIQSVLESSIPNITSALDYTSIDKASGLTNDSLFASLADFGQDIYSRAPNLQVINGAGLAAIIDLVQNEVTANVELALAYGDSTGNVANAIAAGSTVSNVSALLSDDIIASLKTYLPISENGGPVSVMNIIGSAAGYMTEALTAVNEGIARLYATDYGIRIRDALTDISRFWSRYPLTEAESALTAADWDNLLESKKTEYYAILTEVVSDQTGDMPDIVRAINENYDWCCRNLHLENKNWVKANLQISKFDDTSQYLGFVSSVPSYAADVENIGTDYLLYGLCQDTTVGEVAKVVLAEGKTRTILADAGVPITGIL